MRPALILAATLFGTSATAAVEGAASGAALDPIERAIQNYAQVNTYTVIIRSVKQNKEEELRYYFKRPGFVRMEFIKPHAGAVLVFSPLTQRVRLWPFGESHFPEFNLAPSNPLILSSSGQRVDQSDVGALFENVRALGKVGKAEVLDTSAVMNASHIVVTGFEKHTVGRVHRFDVWLDASHQFPIKVISHDLNGEILETVTMDSLQLNEPLPESLFQP